MPSALPVADIKGALLQRTIPTITTWNRLEGRPRSQSFECALQAEVRDALWMLTKQWQMGEFRGDDAGSPVFANADAENPLDQIPAGGRKARAVRLCNSPRDQGRTSSDSTASARKHSVP